MQRVGKGDEANGRDMKKCCFIDTVWEASENLLEIVRQNAIVSLSKRLDANRRTYNTQHVCYRTYLCYANYAK